MYVDLYIYMRIYACIYTYRSIFLFHTLVLRSTFDICRSTSKSSWKVRRVRFAPLFVELKILKRGWIESDIVQVQGLFVFLWSYALPCKCMFLFSFLRC